MVSSFYPASVREALCVLAETDALPYAGGSDINVSPAADRPLMFIGSIPELKRIYVSEGCTHVGACVTFSEGLASPLLPPLMKLAAAATSSPAVRNVGTFGGNLANGAGKADSVVTEFALDAVLEISSISGTRRIPVEQFYFGRKNVDLRPGELITEILIPLKDYGDSIFFEKVAQRHSLAISNVTAAAVWESAGDRLRSLSLAIGAAGDTVMRCRDIEAEIAGRSFSEIREFNEKYIAEYRERMQFPLDRTGVNYRKQVCCNIIEYIVSEAAEPQSRRR